MPLYSRTGDTGRTRLGDGSRVSKCHPRVESLGAVDELNAAVGMAVASGSLSEALRGLLRSIQCDLLALGADLADPSTQAKTHEGVPAITPARINRLEREIDDLEALLPALRSLVLPGGSSTAGWLHLARTICRRAERRIWALAASEPVNEQAGIYLNRLADLLFVMARYANGQGKDDVLWDPDGTQGA